jgi:hypothetical protein
MSAGGNPTISLHPSAGGVVRDSGKGEDPEGSWSIRENAITTVCRECVY